MDNQVVLNVVGIAESFAQRHGPCGEVGPVNAVSHRVVVELPDLEQVHEAVSLADDLDGAVRVHDRFQADPGGDARLVEGVQCIDPVRRQSGAGFPFAAVVVREQGHRGGEGVALGEQVEIIEGAAAALGKDLDVVAVGVQRADDLASQPVFGIGGLVGVGGETEQDPLPASRLTAAVGLQLLDETGAGFGVGVKGGTGLSGELVRRDGRDVAVAASVGASRIVIDGQWGVLASATFGNVQHGHDAPPYKSVGAFGGEPAGADRTLRHDLY